MMKLLYIYRYLLLGGVTTQLVNRLAFLHKHAEIHFAYLRDYGGGSAFGDHPYLHLFDDLDDLARFIKHEQFDAVVVIDTPEAYQALDQADFTGKVIHEVHTTTRQISYLSSLNSQRADAYLVPSHYVGQLLEQSWPQLERPVYVTPNCLDTTLFTPLSRDQGSEGEEDVKKVRDLFRAGFPPIEQKMILWVGKLDRHKNWPAFLAIAQSLQRERSDCQFWLVGGETAPPQTIRAFLNEAEQRGLLPHLQWVPRLEYERMPLVYQLAQASGGISLSTSHNESFGMTVLESMACACPPLAPNVGALPEVLDGPLSPCLYPPLEEGGINNTGNEDGDHLIEGDQVKIDKSESIEAIAERVSRLLDDHDLRQGIMTAGLKKVEAAYSIEAAGRFYYDTLSKIVY